MKVIAAIACVCMVPVTGASGETEQGGSCLPSSGAVPPPAVLVVYGSSLPGAPESFWVKSLRPGGTARRVIDALVRDVQFATVPDRPSLEDWAEDGILSRAAMHGVRVLPSIVFLDSKGRVFDMMTGGASERSFPEKVARLTEKTRRGRPLTVANDVPKGGDPAAEASAICRAFARIPAEAWFRDYPGTMKRLEKLHCTDPAFLNARAAAERLKKNREMADLLRESLQAQDAGAIRKCLDAWRRIADDSSLPVHERQLILLSMVHPLMVRLEDALYRGAHSPESEEAFNLAIGVLEEVRDMDRTSVCGRRARQLREELRRARLAAARYD